MNPKKDDYMRGYSDGFKEAAARLKDIEDAILACEVGKVELVGVLQNYRAVRRTILAYRNPESAA